MTHYKKVRIAAGWLLVVTFLCLNFVDYPPTAVDTSVLKEKYDPALKSISSIDKLEFVADSIAKKQGVNAISLKYFELLSDVIENRFYHGYSSYNLKDNWIAYLSGSVIKKDYANPVWCNDILKYPQAACSQQAIIMMEMAKRKGLDYRPIFFRHHYCSELFIDSNWYFFDTDLESTLQGETRRDSILDNVQALHKNYPSYENPKMLLEELKNAVRGERNSNVAPRAKLFHTVTKLLSKWLWLIIASLLLIAAYRRKNKQTK